MCVKIKQALLVLFVLLVSVDHADSSNLCPGREDVGGIYVRRGPPLDYFKEIASDYYRLEKRYKRIESRISSLKESSCTVFDLYERLDGILHDHYSLEIKFSPENLRSLMSLTKRIENEDCDIRIDHLPKVVRRILAKREKISVLDGLIQDIETENYMEDFLQYVDLVQCVEYADLVQCVEYADFLEGGERFDFDNKNVRKLNSALRRYRTTMSRTVKIETRILDFFHEHYVPIPGEVRFRNKSINVGVYRPVENQLLIIDFISQIPGNLSTFIKSQDFISCIESIKKEVQYEPSCLRIMFQGVRIPFAGEVIVGEYEYAHLLLECPMRASNDIICRQKKHTPSYVDKRRKEWKASIKRDKAYRKDVLQKGRELYRTCENASGGISRAMGIKEIRFEFEKNVLIFLPKFTKLPSDDEFYPSEEFELPFFEEDFLEWPPDEQGYDEDLDERSFGVDSGLLINSSEG